MSGRNKKLMFFLLVLLLRYYSSYSIMSYDSSVVIKGYFESLHDNDTIQLEVIPQLDKAYFYKADILKSVVKNHSFEFRISNVFAPLQIKLFSFTSLAGNSIYPFWISNGDSLVVYEKNNTWEAGGNRAKFYNAQILLHNSFKQLNNIAFPPNNIQEVRSYFMKMDSLALDCFKSLNAFEKEIEANEFDLLKSDVVLFFQGGKKVSPFFWYFGRSGNNIIHDTFNGYESTVWNDKIEKNFIFSDAIVRCDAFVTFLIDQYIFDSCVVKNAPFQFDKCYLDLSTKYRGKLKESVLFKLLYSYNNRRDQTDVARHIKNALKKGYITDTVYTTVLNEYIEVLDSKKKAFDFSLIDNNDKLVKLSDFRGKVVLLDFWYSSCGPCAKIHPYIEEVRKKFSKANFAIIAISIDKDKFVWLKSIKDGLRTSKEVVNLYTGGKGDDSPVITNYKVNGYPTLVLIDKKGFIQGSIKDPRIDNGENLINTIQINVNINE